MSALFVPKRSVMIGLGLCAHVHGVPRTPDVYEVVSSHVPTTEWDLRAKGWRRVWPDLWTDGGTMVWVHASPQPLPPVSAMRWAYDGANLTYLDLNHAREIRIDDEAARYVSECLRQEGGVKRIKPCWLRALLDLKTAGLPPTRDTDAELLAKAEEAAVAASQRPCQRRAT